MNASASRSGETTLEADGSSQIIPSRHWWTLGILFLIGVFNYLDRTIISILQIPIKEELALSDTQIGLLLGASFGLVYTALGLPLGRLADRISRKKVLSGALFLWTGMTALTSAVRGYPTLLACRVGVAVGEAACAPIAQSLISDLFPRRRRATAVSIWAMSVPMGILLGFLLGGWLSSAVGWRHAILYIGLAGMLLTPVAYLFLHEPSRGYYDGVPERAPLPSLRETWATMWRSRSYRLILVATSLHLFTFYAMHSWLPPFYARVHHLQLADVGATMALVSGVGGAIGMGLAGYGCDRLGTRDIRWYLWMPAIASMIMVPLTLIQLFTTDFSVSVLCGVMNGALLQIFFAPMIATTQSLMPPRIRSFTGAFYTFFVNVLSMSLGPVFVGVLSDRLGPNAGLTIAMSLSLVGTLAAGVIYLAGATTLKNELSRI